MVARYPFLARPPGTRLVIRDQDPAGGEAGRIRVEEPGKFDLAINLRTAKALDLRIAEAFLIRADRVID